jgi:hypothetical protein
MDEIAKKYVHGDFEECLALVVTKFATIQRFYTGSTLTGKVAPRYLHKCDRDKQCECVQLTLYLITLLDRLEAKQSSALNLKERIE